MLIYGFHAVLAQLQQHPEALQILYLQQDKHDPKSTELANLAASHAIPIEYLPKKSLATMTRDAVHQGMIALLKAGSVIKSDTLEAIIPQSLRQNQLLLVLDGITDPHNLGACLRCADAFQVDALIIPKDRAAQVSPIVHKVSCGASHTIPIVTVNNLAQTLKTLKAQGFWTYGLDSAAEESLFQLEFTKPTALVLGAEGSGLRRLTKEHCDFLVKIPMLGHVDSLNVSVATGISLFEIRRQRLLQGT